MRNIRENLDEQIFEMQKMITEKERIIRSAPNGSLRISKSHGRFQCYHLTDSGPTNGAFLKRSQEKLITDLAQKQYDEKLVRSAKKPLAALKLCRNALPETLPEEVYGKLNPDRKPLVTPIILPEQDFVKAWEEEHWTQKYMEPEGPKLYTDKGECVRSKSEIIISNTLFHLGIPYRYECALDLNGYTIYPDFTVLHVRERREKYLEHFGMMADYDYYTRAVNRISQMAKHGIILGDTLFFTMEADKYPLDIKNAEIMFRKWFL